MVNPAQLIVVLGDQLSLDSPALAAGDPARDRVLMAEVLGEATYVPHHPKKIALIFAAMRKFADQLREAGWQVDYTCLDDPDNAGSLAGEILRHSVADTPVQVIEPSEWRVRADLRALPRDVVFHTDTRFISNVAEFAAWAEGRKALRMEYFYRLMRRKTGLLMDGDAPVGGAWNFDAENRKSLPKGIKFPALPEFPPDAVTADVLYLVEARFGQNFGDLRPFNLATTRDQALQLLDHFIRFNLPVFGDYQDAMTGRELYLAHSLLSYAINLGLLSPIEVCQRAEAAFHAGKAPLNAAEGFIRQIIGWREYIRGIYFSQGPDYVAQNQLGHTRALPPLYWGAGTDMACVGHAVAQTRRTGYAHHIQRLMLTGNFALLVGIDPRAVHEWYLSVYIDAFEWVELPNTLGMSQWADGGVVASKPYVSSGAYINRMSDYCKGCAYDVKTRDGAGACPFNSLYWHFLDRHQDRFGQNPRMGPIYRQWQKMDPDRRAAILRSAEGILAKLDAGERV
jgi:deoxyribodipyrimidine photolyase-related protein